MNTIHRLIVTGSVCAAALAGTVAAASAETAAPSRPAGACATCVAPGGVYGLSWFRPTYYVPPVASTFYVTPRVSTYYVAPTAYVAPTTYVAPTVYGYPTVYSYGVGTYGVGAYGACTVAYTC
ncbi:hypothetical protein Sru01_47570 [Sphaerisporangium rufum]|uniref:Uncharacterized protein n=1 Tax=Sphaerisporangium rufum TaxID=1381558 RepID=A0A919R9G2_9ACTN|nr:hypothetical protein [Sphaerisporangium rufum]GII79775.1 hypothetical protein Sru01_47570 [Sphaerisporangium rufum]